MKPKQSSNKRIKDNPSLAELSNTAIAGKNIAWILKMLSSVGLVKDPKLLKMMQDAPRLAQQTEKMINLPDRFNDHFSSKGWIAYESLNFELMENCIDLANNNMYDKAEQLLIEYFNEDILTTHIGWLRTVKAFQPREQLARKAMEDYLACRYYASIPIVLMIIDGLVNDVAPEQKGFFAEGTDVTAWDTIAGHGSGLMELAKLFRQPRKKTTTDEIIMPYRHGILHGRDLNYANPIIAAKVWSALFAVGEWAKAVQAGKKNPQKKEKKEISWRELFKQISENNKRKEKFERMIEKWKPREMTLHKDFPVSGISSEYADGSPEKVFVSFIELWKKRNYGHMAKCFYVPFNKAEYSTKPGEIRNLFDDKQVLGFSIKGISDKAAAVTEVYSIIRYRINNDEREKEIKIRLLFVDDHNDTLVRGDENGSWKIIDGCFSPITNDN